MVLKNRDGTPFGLARPNPLVRSQFWPRKEDVVFHNFVWKGETIPAKKAVRKVKTQSPPPPVPTPPEPVAIVVEETQAPEQTSERLTTLEVNTIITFCLPFVGWSNKQDKLYGESYKAANYGDQFTFETVILERGDLASSFWATETMISKGQEVKTIDCIKPGSILFPSHYKDGNKFADYRWWKVQSVDRYDEGVVIVAIVSDVHPSFH